MSELVNTSLRHKDTRHYLLATASAATLLLWGHAADASDASHPTLWIELGGQLEHLAKVRDPVSAPFVEGEQPWLTPSPHLAPHGIPSGPLVGTDFPGPFAASSPLDLQKPLAHSVGGEGKLVLQPPDSDWQIAVSLRYGRSNGEKSGEQRTEIVPDAKYPERMPNLFWHSQTRTQESHAVLDFQVGRDVGFGLFGRETSTTVNFGVRFAQFTSKFNLNLGANPDIRLYGPLYSIKKYDARFRTYTQEVHDARSFHGLGPSLSWSGSTSVAGTPDSTQLALDWGVNGALLFGRQKAEIVQMTVANDRFKDSNYSEAFHVLLYDRTVPHIRSHSVTVPNIGAFMGLSLKFPNAKVSLGYRGDFFFGAIDGGFDARESRDASFHGPFATISMGL